MMEEVDRHECMHECRSTVGCLHLTTSTLPVSDAMDYVTDNFGSAAATTPPPPLAPAPRPRPRHARRPRVRYELVIESESVPTPG